MARILNQGVNAEDPSSMPTFEDYFKADRGSPPEFLLERSTPNIDGKPVAKAAYTDPAVHDLEIKKLWSRAWQIACRENDIPAVGDWVVYDIGDQSFIIVRVADDLIKALPNACCHRGNRLFDDRGHCSEIQCSFHGWTWNLDGSIKRIPCRWDFPNVTDERARLVEIKVDTWNGWVFVNLDPDACSLEEFLGSDISSQWDRWKRHGFMKVAHVAKEVPCNWKLALEANLEYYHLITSHYERLPYAGDANSQHDTYGPHGRFLMAWGVPSPHLGEMDEQKVLDAMMAGIGYAFDNQKDGTADLPKLAPGQRARDFIADFTKMRLKEMTGRDFTGMNDVEMMDSLAYFIFPNVVMWGGYGYTFALRFRPGPGAPDTCIQEALVFLPLAEGVDLPPDVPMRWTPSDSPWADEADLVTLGPVIDEDAINLRKIQRGLKSDSIQDIIFAEDHERVIRNFHHHCERYLSGG